MSRSTRRPGLVRIALVVRQTVTQRTATVAPRRFEAVRRYLRSRLRPRVLAAAAVSVGLTAALRTVLVRWFQATHGLGILELFVALLLIFVLALLGLIVARWVWRRWPARSPRWYRDAVDRAIASRPTAPGRRP